jgi:hypothetical protein
MPWLQRYPLGDQLKLAVAGRRVMCVSDEIWVGTAALDEVAYHEAGHVVVASAVGLHLGASGIQVWGGPYGYDGCAAICYEDQPWEKHLLCLRAGSKAQLKQFPSCSTMWSAGGDESKTFEIVRKHFNGQWSDMDEKIDAEVDALLEKHWGALEAIAQDVMESNWKPTDDRPPAIRKKQLDGKTLVAILDKHGISAVVR